MNLQSIAKIHIFYPEHPYRYKKTRNYPFPQGNGKYD